MTEEATEIVAEQTEPTSPESVRVDVQPGNLKLYFDEKLHPQLSAALAACANEMPEDPVRFVGEFLLKMAGENAS